jgi:predicted TIM-barrel fold metal-dependent hydrolase
MIVDCYTHVWDSPNQLGRLARSVERRPTASSARPAGPVNAATARHLAAARDVDAVIVLGFKSAYLGADIPNDLVADYVRSHPDKLIGFAGIDPSAPAAALEELERARTVLGLKGIALSPAAQDVHPSSSKLEGIYAKAIEYRMPVLFHPGIQLARESKLEYAQPVLLDEVARDHPQLKMIVAHLGYPWIRETLVLLAKHDNVLADISGLLQQPWETYQALLAAYQMGVSGKLVFGSGFPFFSAAQGIETLYSINHFCAGTSLPGIPREALRSIVESNALELLGIDGLNLRARPKESLYPPEDEAELT